MASKYGGLHGEQVVEEEARGQRGRKRVVEEEEAYEVV
jgi:hypothetical protein